MDADTLDEPVPAALREEALSDQLRLYARDLKQTLLRERRQSAELVAAKARLGRLDRLKLDFLGLISHELRTPLTSMAVVELFDPSRLDPQHAEIVRLVSAGYARLERFVARAVDYFQTLAHLDDGVDAVVDFGELVKARADALAPGLCTELVLAPGPCLVRAAIEPLLRVIATVVDNAVKHSNGKPRMSIGTVLTAATVCLRVRDHGKGFPPEMASEITRALTPADVIHHSEGCALNLALAVQIVESLGGRLVASSEGLGTGATFDIELPLARATTAAPPSELA